MERNYPIEHKNRIIEKINELKNNKKNTQVEINDKKQSSLVDKEFVTDTDFDLLPALKNKSCCWNCLKIIVEENSILKCFDEKIIKYKVVIIYFI